MTIDTGDHVLHRPSGETWVVAYVRHDRLAWCGWPEGTALLADCELVNKASTEDRDRLLDQMAALGNDCARGRYANRRIATQRAHRFLDGMLAERARIEAAQATERDGE